MRHAIEHPDRLPYSKSSLISLREHPMASLGKITAKGQTTVPQEVRASLGAAPGDWLVWELNRDGSATVRRVPPADVEYLRAIEGTLSEWSSAKDEEAYRGL